tara:strand:- start:343 stop:867 length:525 start_codon:yes stop_codon:yes gene_type:complete
MAYQKLQARQALQVITSDTVRIPDPNTVVVLDTVTGATIGTGDLSVLNTLTDVGTKFTESGILPGAIVYAFNRAYYVVSVDSDTQLTLSGGAVGLAANQYSIYTHATIGCSLFIGTVGDIVVQMASQNGNTTPITAPVNQEVIFPKIADASFLPIQVVRVAKTRTLAKGIIALW